MSYVLFLAFLGLFSWQLTKSRFIAEAGLSKKAIILLFMLKVAAGCGFLWIMLQLSTSVDTRGFNRKGLADFHLFFANPKAYFTSFFNSNYNNDYGGVLSSTNSYWNDLSSNLLIKFLSACDFFSGGNYYINVIFYNFVCFFGIAGLFRVFTAIYKNQRLLVIISCFLLPSLLLYSSTIHKEGFIIAALGVAVFNVYMALNSTGFTIKRVVFIFLALCVVFIFRNYVLVAALPAFFAWIVSVVKKYRPVITFAVTYIIGAILFFNVALVFPSINLPAAVTGKQAAFEQLGVPATFVATDSLAPTAKSFIVNAPGAFNHSILRPYFTDIKKSPFLLPFAIEFFAYQLLLVFFIFFKRRPVISDPCIVFGIFFSLSICLIIGYTVPVIGAIVRYRSIYLPFLITPLLCNIDWKRIRGMYK